MGGTKNADSIERPEISAYVREKIKTMQAVAERAKAVEKYAYCRVRYVSIGN